ncbi:MAG: NIPSNAP family protein [Terriglobia bacterium]
MMDRRSFLLKGASGAAAASAVPLIAGSGLATSATGADAPTLPYLVEWVTFRLQSGPQVTNALRWLEKRAMPLWQKHKFGPVGVFTVDVGGHLPAVHFMRIYLSLSDRQAVWSELRADPEWDATLADLEKDGPAFYREDMILLNSTPFSPPIKPWATGDPTHKIYELRIYESPTWKQLGYLHDRFAGGEIDIFHKSGIHPVFYADTLTGPNQPNMVYMIPFESAAQREQAWQTFRENPDWVKIREESIRKGGEIVRNITNMVLIPTGFSMLR